MSTVIHGHDPAHGHGEAHEHHGPPHGITRWLYTTNHKDIGTMYLWFSMTMFFIGGMLALGIRAELFQPGLQFWKPEFFNQLTTMHGVIMVFGAIMPAFVGFANWQVPMMIGAPDMAFARLNNWSFWLLPFAASLLVLSFFMPGGAPGVGWTMYSPLTVQMGMGMDFTIFAVLFLGLLPEAAARRLIGEPSERAGVPFPAEIQDFLYGLVGGHPEALQIACFHAFQAPTDLPKIEQDTLEELEEILITADIGVATAVELIRTSGRAPVCVLRQPLGGTQDAVEPPLPMADLVRPAYVH